MVKGCVSSVVACAVFLWFSGNASSGTRLEALYRAARGDGKVVVWSPLREIGGILAKRFERQFPGVAVEFFEIREDDYIARVIAETRQGIVSFDVGTTRYATISPFIERNLIKTYGDWNATFEGLNTGSVNYGGRFLTFTDHVFPVAYNVQLVNPDQAPNRWEDLMDPRWRGKLLLEPRGMAFAYVGLRWGQERMVKYLEELKEQKPRFVKGGTALLQQLSAGAGALAVGGYVHRLFQLKRDGAPIDWAKKVSPIGAMVQDIFIMEGSRHPNAAKLLAGWLASGEAQGVLNAERFMGALSAGGNFVVAKEIEANTVEVIGETLENYEEAARLTKVAMKTLGALR